MKQKYIIGIDPGVNTGIALWDRGDKEFAFVSCMGICVAMGHISWWLLNIAERDEMLIRFEDARLRKWFGNSGREQLQGAGSIKRGCSIWQEYCEKEGFAYEMVPPKNNKTKLNAVTFKAITGWTKQTNEHSRDAAMLVYNY